MADNAAGRLAGKVALISGGSRGQGEAEARLFVAEGARVVIGDVLDELGEKVAADIGQDVVAYQHLDVRREEDWAAIVELAKAHFGGIDVLVNNAGVFRYGPLLDTTLAEYQDTIDINQTGTFLGMRAVAPVMIAQGRGGSIVNISSVAGLGASGPFFAYGASKWAVRGMTKSAARELGAHKIRVNSVHPGIIATEMLDVLKPLGIRDRLVDNVPIGEESGPEEVAKLVLFLASEDSRHSTGSEFIIDGGMTA